MADMRIGGLASGMDIDGIVGDLMKAERIPLDKMEQEKTKLEWQRDAYRDVNKNILELEKMTLDLKLQKTYETKQVSSSDEAAVQATATASAGNGSYNVKVDQLATAAIKVGEQLSTKGLDPSTSLTAQNPALTGSKFTLTTYGEKGGGTPKEFTIEDGDTLDDVMKKVNDSNIGVRAFYDKTADRVVMERTETGDFNKGGEEIEFGGNLDFFNTVGLANAGTSVAETGGQNAKFTYNNALQVETESNSYTMNGVTFNFNRVTTDNVRVNISNDVDASMDKITKFVEKYNELVESLNEQTKEKPNRDYAPLTEKQKESMEEKEIELWTEQAKKGLLYNEGVLENGMSKLRTNWYEPVDNDGAYSQLAQIGISTTANYLDGGKLEIDEDKLRGALQDNPDSVYKLFSGKDASGNSVGIAQRLDDTLTGMKKSIEEKAGKSTSLTNNYTIGRNLEDVKQEMEAFEDRLNQIEDRYWAQFTEMEKAIQQMNSQSNYLAQQL
ncbi:flagellar cap protein FliD [Pontibacillus halophilus JSM 076056 = DSM 19796]|uniref:Flagellar hook-associated protein 2 n=1 Tax=Pontibacillus halophilus JSM 076056 = DSM 19796 TaxID=1385510 RepID=A0A0A5IDN9_9BACI|nr:flagellar hook-associated protein 2 [Pontibacillus halophilus]KGX93957.1 flagellar cap protein FliD [Pontibacillus halophilus JSM 076056 = DSM 19796]